MKKITLYQTSATDEVVISIVTNGRASRLYLTSEEAQHLSNRLQAFAKGQQDQIETVITKEDQ